MRESKDSNIADENDESAHRFWRKLQKKIAECNHGIVHKRVQRPQLKWWKQRFDENYKKSRSEMRWRMVRCKFYSENVENNNFDEDYKKLSSAMTWRIIGSKFYSKKDENDKNNDSGENLLSWMAGSRHLNGDDYLNEHGKKLLFTGMTWNTRGLGTYGNNDNVMLKVLDTANPTIC